jgi:hypothetical protein
MTARHEDIRAAIDILGGPSEMSRIWGINIRNAQYYAAGHQPLPPKRLAQLIEALRARATEANYLADVLAKAIVLKVAVFDGETIKPLSEKEP